MENKEMSREEFLKANCSRKELHETVGQYNIVEFVGEFGQNHEITCLMTDVVIYDAPETTWSVKLNKYVETGNTIKKASVIVKLPVDENTWSDEEYMVYCPMSNVEILETLKFNNWVEGTLITFDTFTNDSSKTLGYIKTMN